jgi:ribosomal 50S subunit-recycling heat shock protein
MCEAGAVKLNGARAKSAHVVRGEDELSIRQRGKVTTVKVLEVPTKQVSKAQAASLYEVVSVIRYDSDEPEQGS